MTMYCGVNIKPHCFYICEYQRCLHTLATRSMGISYAFTAVATREHIYPGLIWFHLTFYWVYGHLSMLESKLIHVSKGGGICLTGKAHCMHPIIMYCLWIVVIRYGLFLVKSTLGKFDWGVRYVIIVLYVQFWIRLGTVSYRGKKVRTDCHTGVCRSTGSILEGQFP